MEALEQRIAPANLFVTSNADNGAGTLRQAILLANSAAFPGPDLITFNIAVGGPFVIQPLSPLPEITEALTIDGYSSSAGVQLAGTQRNTDPFGTNAVLRVEIDCSLQGSGHGLILGGTGGSKVSGLVIRGLTGSINDNGHGIAIHSDNNAVEGNFIGTDVTGMLDRGNGSAGVSVGLFTGSDSFTGNVIGGIDPTGRNLVSGNATGIQLTDDSFGTTILGNLIGTDRLGATALGNTNAGIAGAATGTIIGGPAAGAKNVISGNTGWGIVFSGVNTTIQGNYIGVVAGGFAALANGDSGIEFQNGASGALVGGAAAGEGNVISGNLGWGIEVGSSIGDGSGDNVRIFGNKIGTDISGGLPIGNGSGGVGVFWSSGSQIGGVNAGEGNMIGFNGGAGVLLDEVGPIPSLRISSNGIHDNAGLGIDIKGGVENLSGVTANDALDADAGANGLQNFPIIATFSNSGASVTLQGALQSTPGTSFRIEFFALSAAQVDPSGSGEAGLYLGFIDATSDAAGKASFVFSQATALPADTHFSATATNSTTSQTSEFSPVVGTPASYTWTGSVSTDWFTPGNWTPSGVPGALDTATFNGGIRDIGLTAPAGIANFTHNAGNFLTASKLTVGSSLTWNGGTHNGGQLILESGATASINGGPVWLRGDFINGGATVVNAGGLQFNEGVFANFGSGAQLTLNAGIVDASGPATPVSFFNDGLVVKAGSGNFGLQGFATDNGGTIESAQGDFLFGALQQGNGGTIFLNGGNISAAIVTLNAGSLTGAGTITGDVTNLGAFVRPGGTGGTGIIAITGKYTQTSGGALAVELSGPVAGTDYDQLTVTGTATLDGRLDVALLAGFTPGSGATFTVVDGGGISGTFSPTTGLGTLTAAYTPTPTPTQVVLKAPLSSLIVTNTNPSGAGSFMQALLDANATPGLDTITFNIPGAGVKTIAPAAALPAITDPVAIDGYSQPGASPNTLVSGDNAVILIELDGSAFSSLANVSACT